MTSKIDHFVREVGGTRLKLRADLVFSPHGTQDDAFYLIEDPLNSRFYRLGQAEYTFVSLLDGETTVHEVLSHLSSVMPHHVLSENDAAGLCRWLIESDLAVSSEPAGGGSLAKRDATTESRKSMARWNPLVIRIPILRSDRAFSALAKRFGWVYSPQVSACWFVLVIWSFYLVFSQWDRFVVSSQGVFAPNNWLWLGAAWVFLKTIHEASHGIVCKRYGGTVREAGLLLILFAPLAYVDVTSSWRFRLRRERIHVAAAGMYVELLVAGLAAMVWSHTESQWLCNLSFNLIVMASFSTLLFNANPLMKFDGYYIVSDGLAIPNLYVNGQQYLRYWCRTHLLGVPTMLPDWSPPKRALISLYGWMSIVWRLLVCACLTIAAATLFHGAGIVLACLAIVLWIGLPTLKFAEYFTYGRPGEEPQRLRFALKVGSVVALMTVLVIVVPWPGACEAPAVVEYSPHTVVRTASPGFIQAIHVQSDQRVHAGQVLVVLANRELAIDVARLELAIRQSDIRSRRHEQKGQLSAAQAEADSRKALVAKLVEKRDQLGLLKVRAPCKGKVVSRNLQSLLGTYREAGDEIVCIGDDSHTELRVSIAQDDLEVFARRTGREIQVDIPGKPLWRSRLQMIIPRATRAPPHPGLAATNGGPLPMVSTQAMSEPNGKTYELLERRFTGVVRLDANKSRLLRSGQIGSVRYRPCDESIGEHVVNAVSKWIRRRLRACDE